MNRPGHQIPVKHLLQDIKKGHGALTDQRLHIHPGLIQSVFWPVSWNEGDYSNLYTFIVILCYKCI